MKLRVISEWISVAAMQFTFTVMSAWMQRTTFVCKATVKLLVIGLYWRPFMLCLLEFTAQLKADYLSGFAQAS